MIVYLIFLPLARPEKYARLIFMIIQSLEKNLFKIISKDKTMVYLQGNTSKITNAKNKQVFIISMPGEYEVSGIFVQAFALTKKSLAFLVKIENISLLYLEQTHKLLSDQKIEELSNVEILFMPFGKNSLKIIKQIEPCILIPFGRKTEVSKLIQEIGIKPKKIDNNKLNIKKTDLPDEGMEVMVFE